MFEYLHCYYSECRSGLSFPSPGDLPNPGVEPRSPALQADSLLPEPPGKLLKPFLSCDSLVAFSVHREWKQGARHSSGWWNHKHDQVCRQDLCVEGLSAQPRKLMLQWSLPEKSPEQFWGKNRNLSDVMRKRTLFWAGQAAWLNIKIWISVPEKAVSCLGD